MTAELTHKMVMGVYYQWSTEGTEKYFHNIELRSLTHARPSTLAPPLQNRYLSLSGHSSTSWVIEINVYLRIYLIIPMGFR